MSSRTPDGGYQPTFASNFMLDGFDFSEEYGEGPLMNHKIPTTSRTTGMPAATRSESGLSHLPDGIVTAASESPVGDDLFSGAEGTDLGDLSGMVREAAHLSDLSWLELAEQDPDRLPQQPNDKVLQGLVEAWGVNGRTDGVELVPNVEVPPPPRSQVSLLPGDDALRQVVASAMRKSSFGVPFENILSDVAAHLGPESLARVSSDPNLRRFASAVRSIRAEHGILGKVYLRDSAFPGLLAGKWDREIKKRCTSARYWLTRPGSKLAAYENYLGKRVVTEIPWGEALDHYRPTLEASGKRLASGDPKTVLLSAIREEVSRVEKTSSHTYHLTPAERVSLREAWKVFASAPAPRREIVRKESVRVSLEEARQKFAGWVRAGLLDEKTASEFLAGNPPEEALREGASRIASTHKRSKYEGHGIDAKLPERRTRNSDWANEEGARVVKAKEDRSVQSSLDKVSSVFRTWVKAGSLTQDQSDFILSRVSGDEAIRLGQLFINRAKKSQYAGQGWGRKIHAGGPAKKLANADDPKVLQVLRYASVQMNEGAAGKDLDVLLNSRFSQEYLNGASGPLVQLRRKREGLAGHVYIAADAYATPSGTTGCDKGALIHRANQVKAVLQMDRCGSCASNSDGHCQKYNKALVTAAPVEDPERYQRETIRFANADDSERTAAMFNNYDPGEFDLQNDTLDTFSYDNLPDHDTLNGILFEGMILPEE